MAADVGSLVRIMNGYKEDQQQKQKKNESVKSTAPITRDLLGGSSSTLDSKELDLDLQVPSGWEKRLDLKSGKVYLQKCNSPDTTTLSSDHGKNHHSERIPKLQDLNFPPSSRYPLNLFDETSLELKLVSSTSSTSSSSSNYQSVCTLDKVKSALERAERETIKKRSISVSMSMSMSKSSPSPSNSSSSIRETETDYEDKPCSSFAAGCPSCLLYVLISKENPKCPRCNTVVPSPFAIKKPRIDLNISI